MTEPLIDATDLVLTDDVQTELASARVRAYCRWHIYPSRTETLTLDGPGGRLLLLPSLYVTAVASISDSGTLVDAADYDWSQAGMVQRQTGWWSCRYRALAVTFTHGYDDVPDAVRDVTISVAKRLPAAMSGVTQEQVGGESRTYGGLLTAAAGDTLTDGEKRALAPYALVYRP